MAWVIKTQDDGRLVLGYFVGVVVGFATFASDRGRAEKFPTKAAARRAIGRTGRDPDFYDYEKIEARSAA